MYFEDVTEMPSKVQEMHGNCKSQEWEDHKEASV